MLLHNCSECGSEFRSVKAWAEFCGPQCRSTFNNRRFTRGAALYDLYMAHRFERSDAQQARVMAAINRQVSDWREDDKRKRAGRRSWGDWREYLAMRPHLFAMAVHIVAGRGTRKAA